MSTTKQLKVYKGVPTLVKSRARGYWDEKTALTFNTEGESKSVTMSVYDGLNCVISDSANDIKVLDFSATTLPYKWDYSSRLMTSRYCLKASGQSYNVEYYKYFNFTKVGSPNVNEYTGFVNGFSISDYIYCSTSTPSFSQMDLLLKFKCDEFTGDDMAIICARTAVKDIFVQGSDNTLNLWDGYQLFSGSTTLSLHTDYLLRVIYDGSNFKVYLIEDNGYTLDTLPDISQWSNEITTTSNIFRNYNICFGSNPSGNQYFAGSIDLSMAYIDLDNSSWWTPGGYGSYDNFTVVGTPTIDYALGKVSRFSSSRYIHTTDNFASTFSTWEMVCKFKITSGMSYGTIFSIFPDKLIFGVYSTNLLKLWENSTGSYVEQGGTTPLSYNTDYWVKLVWDGSVYTVYLSTTGSFSGEEITEIVLTPGGQLSNCTYCAFGAKPDWAFSYGEIDLSGTYIKVDNSLWWTPLRSFSENLPGILYNYTDDGSAVTLDCYANGDTSVILTEDVDYNGTYLGTVNIPAHNV